MDWSNYKLLNKDKKQFAVSFLNILANNFLPVNRALGLQGKYVHKFRFVALFILMIVGCENKLPEISTCYGAITEGTIWVSISADNIISIGDSVFSEQLLNKKYNVVKQSCKSVVVIVQAEQLAKHKVVYDTVKLIESLNFKVSQ